MTQRNYQNARNQGDGPKGKSRKSAGSAKLKRKAGDSVYTPSKAVQAKRASRSETKAGRDAQKKAQKYESSKAVDTTEQMRRRERAMVSMMRDMPEYKFWRRVWWILMGLTFFVIVLTWIPNMMVNAGMLDESFSETASWISSVGFIFAFVALIGAFFIDFTKIRKLQKRQESKARNLTKSERRELDAAIDAAIEREAKEREERKANRPWARKKKAKEDGADASDDDE